MYIFGTSLQIAILVNGFVLAFTSDFIPRVVYRHQISPDGSLNGYVNWTLSYFNVKDFKPQERPDNPMQNVKEESPTCRYVFLMFLWSLVFDVVL